MRCTSFKGIIQGMLGENPCKSYLYEIMEYRFCHLRIFSHVCFQLLWFRSECPSKVLSVSRAIESREHYTHQRMHLLMSSVAECAEKVGPGWKSQSLEMGPEMVNSFPLMLPPLSDFSHCDMSCFSTSSFQLILLPGLRWLYVEFYELWVKI